MKKIFLILILITMSVFASDTELKENQTIQSKIDNIGAKILNSNRISKRIVFVYDENEKSKFKLDNSSLTKRQIIMYKNSYKSANDDNEIAAFLSREICLSLRSYNGMAQGFLRSLQIKAAPKKFEIVADKIAVDYMVKAGYNPVALITYIQKTSPQLRFDKISAHNLTSKRLAIIYEYIYTKYPYYLKNNEYIDNENYQNFLLTSYNNRKMLEEKIKSNSKKAVKYE